MPTRRTIRKPTRWTPEEWRQIQEAAQRRGVPPLRYVREAALAVELRPPTQFRRRRGAHGLVRQLKRVLNNLHQLLRIAEEENEIATIGMLEPVIGTADQAVLVAATYRGDAGPIIAALVDSGRALNDLTHRAHSDEALPAPQELSPVVEAINQSIELLRR